MGSLNNLNVLNDLNVWNMRAQKRCLRRKFGWVEDYCHKICVSCAIILRARRPGMDCRDPG